MLDEFADDENGNPDDQGPVEEEDDLLSEPEQTANQPEVQPEGATTDENDSFELHKHLDYWAKVKYDIQPVIQPGSTTAVIDDEDDERTERYLCWNSHGFVVRTYKTGDIQGPATLEVLRQKPDGTNERPNFQDTNYFDMAALCSRGVLFARSGLDPDMHIDIDGNRRQALLHFHDFNCWDMKKTWELNFNAELEQIKCIAASDEVIVCCTTGKRRFLRILSPSGMQVHCIQLCGEAIGIACYKGIFIILTSTGTHTGNHDQHYQYKMFEALDGGARLGLLAQGSFVPSPESTVKWLGISSHGIPCVLDSSDVLWGLAPMANSIVSDKSVNATASVLYTFNTEWMWIPLLDFVLEHTTEKYGNFIVDVTEDHVMLATCRDGETQPRAGDRASLRKVALRIPLLGLSAAKSSAGGKNDSQATYEESRLRNTMKKNVVEWAVRKGVAQLLPKEIQTRMARIPDEADEVADAEVDRLKSESDKSAMRLVQRSLKTDFLPKALDAFKVIFGHDEAQAVIDFGMQLKKGRFQQKVTEAWLLRQALEAEVVAAEEADAGGDDPNYLNGSLNENSLENAAAVAANMQLSSDGFDDSNFVSNDNNQSSLLTGQQTIGTTAVPLRLSVRANQTSSRLSTTSAMAAAAAVRNSSLNSDGGGASAAAKRPLIESVMSNTEGSFLSTMSDVLPPLPANKRKSFNPFAK